MKLAFGQSILTQPTSCHLFGECASYQIITLISDGYQTLHYVNDRLMMDELYLCRDLISGNNAYSAKGEKEIAAARELEGFCYSLSAC